MSEGFILVGGIVWAFVIITTVGYSSVLLGAKKWQAGTVGYACALFVATLGVLAIQNAPYIAQTWVWN